MCLSGNEALEIMQARIKESKPPFRLVILDYSMPEKDGPQTAMEIRDLCEANGLPVPFICCATAYSEASFKRNAIEAGMNDFISKPI